MLLTLRLRRRGITHLRRAVYYPQMTCDRFANCTLCRNWDHGHGAPKEFPTLSQVSRVLRPSGYLIGCHQPEITDLVIHSNPTQYLLLVWTSGVGTSSQGALTQPRLIPWGILQSVSLATALLIRILFSVPSPLVGVFNLHNADLPLQVACIGLCSKLRAPESHDNLHRIQPGATPSWQRVARIILIANLVRSVHLFPKFGPVVPAEWSSSTALGRAD